MTCTSYLEYKEELDRVRKNRANNLNYMDYITRQAYLRKK